MVAYNEALYLGQCQGELVRLRKAQQRLQAIQQSVANSAKMPVSPPPPTIRDMIDEVRVADQQIMIERRTVIPVDQLVTTRR